MKNLFFLLFAISILGTAACKKDKETREDFVGTWDATESIIISGQTQTRSYTFTVILDPGNPDRIIMQNFGDIGAAISATVSGKTFTTESLNILINGEPGTAQSTGTIDKNKLTYSIEFKSSLVTEKYNGTATRR